MRKQYDAYYTHQGLTLELLKYLDLTQYKTALEPCVGDGHIYSVVSQKHPHLQWTTNDIDLTKQADYHCDAADYSNESLYKTWSDGIQEAYWDICITNFPYNQQNEIVPLVWQHVDVLAFLCRLSWLEPVEKRAKWLKENEHHCKHQIIFSNPRPRFTEKGNDSVTTMWLVYDKSYNGLTQKIYATEWTENKL